MPTVMNVNEAKTNFSGILSNPTFQEKRENSGNAGVFSLFG